jgi:hypothetical protein
MSLGMKSKSGKLEQFLEKMETLGTAYCGKKPKLSVVNLTWKYKVVQQSSKNTETASLYINKDESNNINIKIKKI